MVVDKNILKNKMPKEFVVIILESQFFMILRKDGHVVIKFNMIGKDLKKYHFVLSENIRMLK